MFAYSFKSLRGRVLLLFAVFAVGPLLTLGLLDYVRAKREVERVVAVQVDTAAVRAARAVRDQYATVQSDILLFTENAETQRLLTTLAAGDTRNLPTARARADTFLKSVWRNTARSYRSLEIRDLRDSVVLRATAGALAPDQAYDDVATNIREPIHDVVSHRLLGDIVLGAQIENLLPADLARLPFGQSGNLVVVNRATDSVVFNARRSEMGVPVRAVLALGAKSDSMGAIHYVDSDSDRVAVYVRLSHPEWTIVASTGLPEFAAGVGAARILDLALVLGIAFAVAVAFTVLIGRTTRSLEELTFAARTVGQGNLDPTLPPPGDDEVGTLSASFDSMLGRLRAMMREIEVSRQLAVVGEFAAQLSHEIRNPLTSLKLNLQGLTRDVRRGTLPADAGPSIETCLREVNRLDTVVRGVLDLGRPRPTVRAECHVHVILGEVLHLLDSQLRNSRVDVTCRLEAARQDVLGDHEQLAGLFMNLILNAAEAPRRDHVGVRRILVTTSTQESNDDGSATIRVTVADDGTGVSDAVRDRIFHPFVTEKPTGTGLGLSIALRTAGEHGGRVELVESVPGYRGAAFRVTLPLAGSTVHA